LDFAHRVEFEEGVGKKLEMKAVGWRDGGLGLVTGEPEERRTRKIMGPASF